MAQAKEIYPGMYIRINHDIFKVVKKEIANFGTHCHSKTRLIIKGLMFKGEKSLNFGHADNVETVDITRKQGQVLSKMPGKVQIMDAVSFETMDADADKEVLDSINEGDNVTFISFEGNTRVLEKRQQ